MIQMKSSVNWASVRGNESYILVSNIPSPSSLFAQAWAAATSGRQERRRASAWTGAVVTGAWRRSAPPQGGARTQGGRRGSAGAPCWAAGWGCSSRWVTGVSVQQEAISPDLISLFMRRWHEGREAKYLQSKLNTGNWNKNPAWWEVFSSGWKVSRVLSGLNTETWLTTVSMLLTESLPVHSCCSLCLINTKHLNTCLHHTFFSLFSLSCSWAAQKPLKRHTIRPKWPLDATKGRCSSLWTLCRVEVSERGSGNPLNWDTSTLKCGFQG